MNIQDKLTILLPTYNRHDKLERCLRYIDSVGSPCEIHILDSSETHFNHTAFTELFERNHITYKTFNSDIVVVDKIYQGLLAVKTPYVVLWADDDFMVLPTLQECVQFLEDNKDYSGALGEQCYFIMDDKTPHSTIIKSFWRQARQQGYVKENAVDRLMDYYSNPPITLYWFVQRTENVIQNIKWCVETYFNYYYGEIVLGSCMLLQGKVCCLPVLSMVREAHAGQDSANKVPLWGLDWKAILKHPDNNAYRRWGEIVADYLITVNNMPPSEAKDTAEEMIDAYFSYLENRSPKLHTKIYRGIIMQCLLPLRLVSRLIRKIFFKGQRKEMRKLMQLKDFAPIYNAIIHARKHIEK